MWRESFDHILYPNEKLKRIKDAKHFVYVRYHIQTLVSCMGHTVIIY